MDDLKSVTERVLPRIEERHEPLPNRYGELSTTSIAAGISARKRADDVAIRQARGEHIIGHDADDDRGRAEVRLPECSPARSHVTRPIGASAKRTSLTRCMRRSSTAAVNRITASLASSDGCSETNPSVIHRWVPLRGLRRRRPQAAGPPSRASRGPDQRQAAGTRDSRCASRRASA